jgi:hypothetical protein
VRGSDPTLFNPKDKRPVPALKMVRADLPVEVVEFYPAIDLKTAEAIGLTIRDEVLGRFYHPIELV